MGIEDRDYFREPSKKGSGWGAGSGWSICNYLIAANIIIFLAQIFFTSAPDIPPHVVRPEGMSQHRFEYELKDWQTNMPRVSVVQELFALDAHKVTRGQIWRLLTYAFCHSRTDFFHIVFNLLFLYWFGKTLETMYGSREFLLFYLSAAILSGAAFVGLNLFTGDVAPAIGASGAVMGVMMLYAIHYPKHTILLWWIIPVRISWVVFFYVLYDLHPVLLALSGESQSTGIAHAAHLGGLAFGFVYWKTRIRIESILFKAKRTKGKHQIHLRLVTHEKETTGKLAVHVEDQVDTILAKIHEHGVESLTEEERETLKDASKSLRKKKK